MAEDPKFVIGEVEYLVPSSFRLADPVLVEEVTGLDFEEFSRRLDEVNQSIGTDDAKSDYKVTVGLVACAVWQKNPRWSRAKVLQFLEQVDVQSLSVQVPEAPADDPPTEAPTEPPATSTSGRSKTPGKDTSGGSTTTPADSPAEALV